MFLWIIVFFTFIIGFVDAADDWNDYSIVIFNYPRIKFFLEQQY